MACLDVSKLFNVEGMVAVVTGGGTGIGLMLAQGLEHNGATVYIAGRRLDKLEKAAKDGSKHGRIIPVQCDVTSRDSLLSLVSHIEEKHGYVNLLINNAGTMHPKLPQRENDESLRSFRERLWTAGTPEHWADTFAVNVTAVYYTTVAFLSLLDQGNRRAIPALQGVKSQVITVTSNNGFRRDEKTYSLAYAASKAGANHLCKIFTNLLKEFDIRSNVIAPGMYPSEMTEGYIPDVISRDIVPMQRTGEAEDMAGVVLFLASRAGAYVNGCVHISDGARGSLFPSTY